MHMDPGTTSLVEELVRVVTVALRQSRRAEMELIDAHTLSMSQYKILSMLDCADEGLRPSELAEKIGLSPGATSRAAEGMVQDGLVTRSDDASDRRVRTLTLSEHGRGFAEPLWSARREAVTELVSELSAEEQRALSAALQPLLDIWGQHK